MAPKPVNLLINAPFTTVVESAGLGVRRISVGGTLARAAWGGALAAARELAGSRVMPFASAGKSRSRRAA